LGKTLSFPGRPLRWSALPSHAALPFPARIAK
jgi:hypothetical protein